MKHLGITGNMGSGKSTVCRIFESLNIPVYYSDARAKHLMQHNKKVISSIKTLLGDEAYNENKVLDRVYVAQKIFNNSDLLRGINEIVHPAVRKDYLEWRAQQKSVFTLQESALSFEIGAESIMDAMILVYAPEALLISRSMLRDQKTKEDIKSRLAQQMDQEVKKGLADWVIYNALGDLLLPQIVKIYEKYSKIDEFRK